MFFRIGKELILSTIHFPTTVLGLWRISRLHTPIISVFGGKHMSPDSKYWHMAYQIGYRLRAQGYSVLTGGGAGIMEAALCGALKDGINHAYALGIGVKGLDDDFVSECGQQAVFVRNLGVRKRLLCNYSAGAVFFPGGIGTLSELMELFDGIKIGHIKPVPTVLFGIAFWQPILDWLSRAQTNGYIISTSPLCIVTDSIEHALEYIGTQASQ